MKMFTLALFGFATLSLAACHGPGGPGQRTGRTVDHAAASVGHGIEKTGEKIQDATH